MYELNTGFAVLDRSEYASDCERARQFHVDAGAQDILMGEIISGMNAGGIGWSTRWPTLDAALGMMRHSASVATDPDNPNHDVRSRYQLTNRTLNRVINDVGERAGPCLLVGAVTTTKPVPVEENLHALETYVASGGKGAGTVLSMDGEGLGRYLVSLYGDSFEQIATAQAAMLRDSQVMAAIVDTGTTPVGNIWFDVA